jgi:N-acetylglucosaminyldiphosphoundecaprenol N-acetyl-beta-D-mannosaminyltransferase
LAHGCAVDAGSPGANRATVDLSTPHDVACSGEKGPAGGPAGTGPVAIMATWRRASALGVALDLLTTAELLDVVEGAIRAGRRMVIGHLNLHGAYLNQHDPAMRAFLRRADLVFVDGVAIIWWLRALGEPARLAHRTTYVDLIEPLLRRVAALSRVVFYLGGRPDVANRCLRHLAARIPGLHHEAHHGYLDAAIGTGENERVIAAINQAHPGLLLVGMGMPRQERWVLENMGRVDVPVIMTCGGLADYVVGDIPTAPRALAAIGLEWAFRLATQPRRVWRRYLVEPWGLLPLCWRDARRHWRARHAGPP